MPAGVGGTSGRGPSPQPFWSVWLRHSPTSLCSHPQLRERPKLVLVTRGTRRASDPLVCHPHPVCASVGFNPPPKLPRPSHLKLGPHPNAGQPLDKIRGVFKKCVLLEELVWANSRYSWLTRRKRGREVYHNPPHPKISLNDAGLSNPLQFAVQTGKQNPHNHHRTDPGMGSVFPRSHTPRENEHPQPVALVINCCAQFFATTIYKKCVHMTLRDPGSAQRQRPSKQGTCR